MKRTILTPLAAALLAVSLASPVPAGGQSTPSSELLEKGIYAEETKGDLDAAIALYQQLINEAKANQHLAAQAQLRLAQCFLKKNRTVDAIAAFERLIKDFPNEKELVAKAREHVPGDLVLVPVPWADGEELQLTLKLGNGLDVGTLVYHARAAELEGRKIWEVGGRMFAVTQSFSRVQVAADDFRPISSRWMHALLGDVTATYGDGKVSLQSAGKAEAKVVPVDGRVYDNEECMHLMRRLPLAVGFKANLPIFSTLGGGGIPLSIEVKETEMVETPIGKQECFKVEISPIQQTFWFSTDAKHTVYKFSGGGVTGELIAIAHRARGEAVRFQNEKLGISLAAPAEWVIHYQDPDNEPNLSSIYLLDPEAKAGNCLLRLHAMSALSDEEKKSSRAWADSRLVKLAKVTKDLKVRPESWKELKVSGRPAVSFLADYVEKEQPMVIRGVCALGQGENAEEFVLMAEAANFEALQPAFEGIVASYQSK